ncbi:MAG: peptidoglycan DD-metalloendopeptidase family protein [Firmicutes bacterium]|nr:peptidoglycan DD-metalloendopeptidase family protein [Bacillota bacterium]
MKPVLRLLKKHRYSIVFVFAVLLVLLVVSAFKNASVPVATASFAADILDSQREDSAEAVVMGETYGVVYLDDVAIASLATYEEAASVRDRVLAYYQTGTSEIISYSIAENIEAREVIGVPWNVMTVDGAVSLIVNGTEEAKTYTVVAGDSYWSISRKVGMTLDELYAANPGSKGTTLLVGEVLNIIEVKPMVHVSITERVTETETVGFKTEYESNSSVYIGQYQLKRAGVRGVNQVTYEITSENGVRQSKTRLDTVTVSEPVTQIMYKGTKPLPNVIGTGVFRFPLATKTYITSNYGIYRPAYGGVHKGTDFAAQTGDSIYAVDDGVVTFSGESGTYGYLVKLSHGNGYETYYAHCSKLLVNVGDSVKKGDVIALVGQTGRASGPHLHFEVRVYGTVKNPLDYLP